MHRSTSLSKKLPLLLSSCRVHLPGGTLTYADVERLSRRFAAFLQQGLSLSTDVRIASDDGVKLAIGEIGEICVRGPQVVHGYWNEPSETAQVLTADGWLCTGDIGRMHARGYIEFLERKKDVIVVSGFKAYPTEIEALVMQHRGVKDAAAIGIPDGHTWEAVALFVNEKRPDSDGLSDTRSLQSASHRLQAVEDYRVSRAAPEKCDRQDAGRALVPHVAAAVG